MARYKDYNYHQQKLIPLSFDRQILPGTFEYTLTYLVDHELDLTVFEHRYKNDETGAPAYDPALFWIVKCLLIDLTDILQRSIESAVDRRQLIIYLK
ncbi:MAG: hypothetical protein AB1810_08210 [Pseudomonadota bacterium]